MAMAIVLPLEGVCFINTIVLEHCPLSFRSRNSQPYVHAAPGGAMGRSCRAAGFCPSPAEERGWGPGGRTACAGLPPRQPPSG